MRHPRNRLFYGLGTLIGGRSTKAPQFLVGAFDQEVFMNGTPVFGKWEKIGLLLLGFILTTVCGGLLGAYLQNRSRFRTQQEAIFSDLAKQMDARAYRTRSLIAGFRGDLEFAPLETRRNEYRATLEDWNVSRSRNSVLVLRYFGPLASRCFLQIHVDFLNINRSIRRGADLAKVNGDIEVLEGSIQSFDTFLLNSMKSHPFSTPAPCRVESIPAREGLPKIAPDSSSQH